MDVPRRRGLHSEPKEPWHDRLHSTHPDRMTGQLLYFGFTLGASLGEICLARVGPSMVDGRQLSRLLPGPRVISIVCGSLSCRICTCLNEEHFENSLPMWSSINEMKTFSKSQQEALGPCCSVWPLITTLSIKFGWNQVKSVGGAHLLKILTLEKQSSAETVKRS